MRDVRVRLDVPARCETEHWQLTRNGPKCHLAFSEISRAARSTPRMCYTFQGLSYVAGACWCVGLSCQYPRVALLAVLAGCGAQSICIRH